MRFCCRDIRAILSIALAAALLLILPPPSSASAETVASLTAEFERLVRVEADLFDARETSERRASDPGPILFGGKDGPVSEMTIAEAGVYVDRLIERIDVVGIEQVYLSTLSPFEQMIVATLRDGGLYREKILDRLVRRGEAVRARERTNVATIDAMLEDVRAQAEAVIARRDRLRAAVARGDDSAFSGPGTNPVCLDDAVPVDQRALYWRAGDGGSNTDPVKGDFICRGVPWQTYWFDLVTADALQRWECAEDDPHNCRMNPERTYPITRRYINDEGRDVVDHGTGRPSRVTFYPPQ